MSKLTIGVDIAKNIFHIVVLNKQGKVLKRLKRKREELRYYFTQLEPADVIIEACGSSHYWIRQFNELGHEAKAIAPQYVVPFRKGNKNDYNDAQAIAEAAQRDSMRFVPVKSLEQQSVQTLHRIRELRIKTRTALCNQVRGISAEFGVTIPLGVTKVFAKLPDIIEDAENQLPDLVRGCLAEIQDELSELQQRIKKLDAQIQQVSRDNPICQRLMTMVGIGPIIATTLFAAAGNGSHFSSGRHFSAWLGIVPKQYSTGDRPNLLGISKRGNAYARTQLINGARAALIRADGKSDKVSQWCQALKARLPFNKAVVAYANKMARMAWAMLHHGEDYRFPAKSV